jgi:hypothetical protein
VERPHGRFTRARDAPDGAAGRAWIVESIV